jgi:hypothetical protein
VLNGAVGVVKMVVTRSDSRNNATLFFRDADNLFIGFNDE